MPILWCYVVAKIKRIESLFILTAQLLYVDACTVNVFTARLAKFWQHQAVKFDFTADLTAIGNRSEE